MIILVIAMQFGIFDASVSADYDQSSQDDHSRFYSGDYLTKEGVITEYGENMDWTGADRWENVAFTDQFTSGSRSEWQAISDDDIFNITGGNMLDVNFGGIQSPWTEKQDSETRLVGGDLGGGKQLEGGGSTTSPIGALQNKLDSFFQSEERTQSIGADKDISGHSKTKATGSGGGGLMDNLWAIVAIIIVIVLVVVGWKWYKKRQADKAKLGGAAGAAKNVSPWTKVLG